MSEIKIRIANEEDMREIVSLNSKTWLLTYKNIMSDEVLKERIGSEEERVKKWTETQKRDKSFYLAEYDGKIVGFVSFGKAKNDKYIDMGEVYSLYLLHEYHGKNIGKELLKYAANSLVSSGYNHMIINCLVKNPSLGFYKKTGGIFLEKISIKLYNEEYEEYTVYYPDLSENLNFK